MEHATTPAGSTDAPAEPPRWSLARRQLRVGARALGSLVLGLIAVLGPAALFRQGLLPLIETAFEPSAVWLSVFRRSGIFLAALAGYWAYVHWHEKRAVTELRVQPTRLLLGGAGGAALVAAPIALLFAIGAYELELYRGFSAGLWGVAALIGIAATLEEVLYRCVLFRVLEGAWGTVAALVSHALVFAVQHLENTADGGVGDATTMLVSVTLLGLLWAGVFVFTRNLWVAAANHAAWNFTILLSGVPLSGIEDWRALAPLASRYAGPDWLTGGMFGPESSLVVIVSTTVAVVLLVRAAARRGAFHRPTGSGDLSPRA